jgi:predicted small secreted protein
MQKHLKRFAFLAVVLLAITSLNGCNTFRGVGEDFKAVGRAIQNAGN